ncbi:MAG: hypothetical protein SFU27_06290 [Thermonemataceae bacterium]|nr:hypothetical protein [Thermonemataceae bacterium]
MKKLFFLLGFLCYISALQAQTFEGYVKYSHRVEITDSTLQKNDMAISLFFGSASTLYIKQGFYHWKFVDANIESQTYIPLTNTLYDKFPKNDTLYTTDAELNDEEIVKEDLKPSKLFIFNERMQLYTVKSKFRRSGEKRARMFYFGKKYKLHPDFYLKYKLNANDKIFAKIGNVPLRFMIIYPGFRITYQALEIKQTTVDKKLFEVKGLTKPMPLRK